MNNHSTMKYILFCITIILFSNIPFAQNTATEQQKLIDNLVIKLNALRSGEGDENLKKLNDSFKSDFAEVLDQEWAFDYPFSELKSVGKINSNDKEVRVITWNVEWENYTNGYYGFILKKEKKVGHYLVELVENKITIPPQPSESLTTDEWYGALYYDIIEVEKGRKTYYTLLGFDANNDRSTIKLIDVLYFVGKTPKLGYPIFRTNKGIEKRLYFEHSAKTKMSLSYNKERDMIIFDHLSPESPGLSEFREYYVPDMSYDALVFDKNKWNLVEDIIALNKEETKAKILKYDAKKDTAVAINFKEKWIDPTDKNAPIESLGHKAVTPDDQKNNNDRSTVKKDKKDKNKSKHEGVSYSNLPKNKKKKRKK